MSKLNLLRHLAPVLIGVVGLVFGIVGGFMLISQGWDTASGTVGQCETRTTRTEPGRSSRVERICEVTWETGGTSRTATVNLGGADVARGETVELRVNGGQAVVATPVWVGAGSAGLGAILLLGSLIMLRRARRA